jgi:hypothetical protein
MKTVIARMSTYFTKVFFVILLISLHVLFIACTICRFRATHHTQAYTKYFCTSLYIHHIGIFYVNALVLMRSVFYVIYQFDV